MASHQSPTVPFRPGGHLALDFVNTVNAWSRPYERDYIDTYEKWLRWTVESDLLSSAQARRLRRTDPADAARLLAEVEAIRRAMHTLFSVIVDRGSVVPRALATLNALLADARVNQTLHLGESGFEWTWSAPVDERTPLLKIALASGDLLASEDMRRLKHCPGPVGCGWLFLDKSRNQSRRWCSMEYCGSVAKAKRFAEVHGHDNKTIVA